MTTEEKLDIAKNLVEKLIQLKKSGVISFTDMDEKLSLQTLYKSIYGAVQMDLGCASCVRFYLEQLEAWYQRESAKQVKVNVNPVAEPKKKSIRKSKSKN